MAGWIIALVVAAGLAIWGWLSGQFRGIEQPRYTRLAEREPEPWPGGEDAEESHEPE